DWRRRWIDGSGYADQSWVVLPLLAGRPGAGEGHQPLTARTVRLKWSTGPDRYIRQARIIASTQDRRRHRVAPVGTPGGAHMSWLRRCLWVLLAGAPLPPARGNLCGAGWRTP